MPEGEISVPPPFPSGRKMSPLPSGMTIPDPWPDEPLAQVAALLKVVRSGSGSPPPPPPHGTYPLASGPQVAPVSPPVLPPLSSTRHVTPSSAYTRHPSPDRNGVARAFDQSTPGSIGREGPC